MIGVDCDGPACVVGDPGRSLSFSRDYGFARAQATREADAAARALFDGGAEKVTVWDNHGLGANLSFDSLDPRCEVALGTGFSRRWPGLDEGFAGVLMVGYHAMEGTPGGILAHTYSPLAYRWVKVNGQEVGEIALDAAVAGEFGVPLLFVASDECGCAEARRFMPWVEPVATKRGTGRNCAFSKHPARAVEEIYDGVRRALSHMDQMRPLMFPAPVEVEIRFKRVLQACKARIRRKGWRLAGPLTIRRTFESLRDWSG
jgi:D-amino peptidase